MNKKLSFLLLCFGVFVLLARTQTTPPPPSNSGSSSSDNPNNDESKDAPPTPSTGTSTQTQALTSAPPMSWYCDIQFYYNGKPYYTESLEYGDTEAFRGSFSSKVNNKITEVYWQGDRCYCWIVVYQDTYFNGLNLGLWTDSQAGYYQLSNYITYDWGDGDWETWDTTVSSYAVYCY